MREEAFQKAIESDETIPLSETYDVGATTIDASYDGPRPLVGNF